MKSQHSELANRGVCRPCHLQMLAYVVLVVPTLVGCQKLPDVAGKATEKTEHRLRKVAVIKPQRTTIRREVGQPGMIEAFERTPIVSKIPGYVLKWNVDIGDAIRKDDVLAELWVPEMDSELKLKEQQVLQAKKALAMSLAQIATAKARIDEAEAALSRSEANNEYWKGQSTRFASLVKQSVLDKQSEEETKNQYRSAAAALSEAQAKIQSAKAVAQEMESARDKAEVDVGAADAERQRQTDLVMYKVLTAPYDGLVTQRNINTRQFVQPATGAQADVLYVVERIDVVRIFVSVPETDASWVRVGTPATIRVPALQGQQFKGVVTRTAWALNKVTRTLRAEIDLENPDRPNVGRRLRPGMYAYGTIEAEWPDVLTLPSSAVMIDGDVNVGYQSFCFLVEDGKVKRTAIETGIRNDKCVEVLKKRVTEGDKSSWQSFSGSEEAVQGELAGIKDGETVDVSSPQK